MAAGPLSEGETAHRLGSGMWNSTLVSPGSLGFWSPAPPALLLQLPCQKRSSVSTPSLCEKQVTSWRRLLMFHSPKQVGPDVLNWTGAEYDRMCLTGQRQRAVCTQEVCQEACLPLIGQDEKCGGLRFCVFKPLQNMTL